VVSTVAPDVQATARGAAWTCASVQVENARNVLPRRIAALYAARCAVTEY